MDDFSEKFKVLTQVIGFTCLCIELWLWTLQLHWFYNDGGMVIVKYALTNILNASVLFIFGKSYTNTVLS